MYEYRVMDMGTRAGVQVEINKRAEEGWEPILAYYDVKWFGLLGPMGRRHVVIFRRQKQQS